MKTTSDMNIRVPGLLKTQLVHVGIASISPGDYMIGIGAKWCKFKCVVQIGRVVYKSTPKKIVQIGNVKAW